MNSVLLRSFKLPIEEGVWIFGRIVGYRDKATIVSGDSVYYVKNFLELQEHVKSRVGLIYAGEIRYEAEAVAAFCVENARGFVEIKNMAILFKDGSTVLIVAKNEISVE